MDTRKEDSIFNYRVPLIRTLPGLVLILIFAYASMHFAQNNSKGLRINGIFTFTPTEATMLFWFFTAVCIVGAILMGSLVVRSIKEPVQLEVTPEQVIAPAGSFRNKMLNIAFADIHDMQLQTTKNYKMLIIKSKAGEARVMSSGFASEIEFQSFIQQIAVRLRR